MRRHVCEPGDDPRGHSLVLHHLGAARDSIVRPDPVSAGGADNVDIGASGLDIANNPIHSKAGDRHSSRRVAFRSTVLVVLLNHDAIIGDVRQGNVVVNDIRDRPDLIEPGFDADAIGRVGNFGVENANPSDRVTAADRTDRQAMAA